MKKMLDIEPRNRPTAAQVCLHPWMKNAPSIGTQIYEKIGFSKPTEENTKEKVTSAEVKVNANFPS